jgi:hypothetical protein
MSSTSSSDELTRWVSAWAKGMVSLFVEPWRFLEELGGPTSYQSQVFTATADPVATRTLELEDDLTPGIGRPKHPEEAIPASSVQFEPPQLGPGDTAFRLLVEAGAVEDRPGGTYWGTVSVGDTGGLAGIFAAADTVQVWIVIP